MCFNKESSITTFLFSIVVSYLLYRRNKNNDRAISLIAFIFSLVQLFEFFLWIYINNNVFNNIITKLLSILVVVQPFFVVLFIFKYGKIIIEKDKLKIFLNLTAIITIIASIFTMLSPSTLTTVSKINKNLSWGFYTNDDYLKNNDFYKLLSNSFYIFYHVTIYSCILLLKNNFDKIFLFLSVLITQLYSVYKSNDEITIKDNENWRSLWCNLSNFIFLAYYLIKKH